MHHLAIARILLVLALTADPRPLTSIDEALRLSPEQAASGIPVRLRGIVTYADPVTRDFFVAQDDGAGISMWYPDPGVALTQGDLVEFEGRTERGEYAPKIATPLNRLEVLGHDRPVPVTLPTQAALTANGLDCRHIETDAVVRDVVVHGRQVELRLATLLGPTRLLFATGVPAEPLSGLPGAEINVQATVGVDLNSAHQRIGLRLYAQSVRSIRVLHPSQPVSALPHRPLANLLRFGRTEHLDPRVVVEGDVIYVSGRQVFIADDGVVARLQLAESEAGAAPPPLGARVQVLGFVEPGDPLPRMLDAHILSVRGPGTVRPIDVTGASLLLRDLDDHLVRLRGRVVSIVRQPVQLLNLETAHGPALVTAPEPGMFQAGSLEIGARVEAIGIKSRAEDQVTPLVLLRRRGDLRVIEPPPFWSMARVLALAAIAAALALVMLLKWLWTSVRARELQHRVDERTAELSEANHALEERSKDLEDQHRELVELHHVRARFIATVAHDLRSPLTAVIVGAPLLARERDLERRRQLSDELVEASQNINQELDHLVRAYREEHQLLRNEPVDVIAAVDGAVHSARSLLERKDQVIEVVRPEGRVWARGDAAVFYHVVLNLLSNASKFSPRGTRVKVTVSAEPPQVRVTDEGPGLDARNLARLFDRTERPDVRPTESEPTSGEGLLLCDRWMKTMGGSIGCKSVPGHGSTFELRLMPDDTRHEEDSPVAYASAAGFGRA